MADRLTQLQICLDQLVEQFNATVNYVNNNSDPGMLDEDEASVINIAANAPVPGQAVPTAPAANLVPAATQSPAQSTTQQSPQSAKQQSPAHQSPQSPDQASSGLNSSASTTSNFNNTISELSTDIILKSRQISMLIDSLPGIGVSPESQLKIIEDLTEELKVVDKERSKKIEEKDMMLKWCESLIIEVAGGIAESRST